MEACVNTNISSIESKFLVNQNQYNFSSITSKYVTSKLRQIGLVSIWRNYSSCDHDNGYWQFSQTLQLLIFNEELKLYIRWILSFKPTECIPGCIAGVGVRVLQRHYVKWCQGGRARLCRYHTTKPCHVPGTNMVVFGANWKRKHQLSTIKLLSFTNES